ncbi:MAG TPA: alpha/beta hydrolase [Vicinamibacterales bacterium]|jgi:pimeloyl-ACP methyl ester carboxylesterase
MAHTTAPTLEKARTADGVAIAYTTIGTGPVALIALHGWGGAGSGHSWRDVITHLDLTGLRFIAVDLRGHGASDRTETGFDLDVFGRDVLAVADHAGVGRFILVAYSMSGRWSQWIACTFCDRVLGQILIAPAPACALPLSNELLESWMRETRTRESFEPWVNQFTSEPLPADIVDAYFDDVSRASDRAKRETFGMLCRDDFSDSLKATASRTLVLAGAHDPILSPEFLRQETVARIPGARLVRFDCGHEIPVERPAQAAAVMEAFLAGLIVGARV